MEKIPKYIFLILAMIGYLTIQAQDVSNQPAKSNDVNKSSSIVVGLPSSDPKFSPDQEVPRQTLSNNPAKIPANMFDPKMKNDESSGVHESGSTNPKPPVDQQKDTKLNADGTLPHPEEVIPLIKTENSIAKPYDKRTNEQPAGAAPKTVTNYREIKGSDTQPAPAQSAKGVNYRELRGTKTQPAGEPPKR